MSRKRSKVIKLTILSAASLLVGGCGGCDDDKAGKGAGADFPQIDPTLARKAVAAGTGAVVSDAFMQSIGLIAAGPLNGLITPVQAAHVGMTVDMAVETADVTAHESGLHASSTGQSNSTSTQYRRTYHYHSSPGIGWFLWGHYLGRSSSMAGQPYTPPRSYGTTPRQFQPRPSSGGGSSYAGGSSTGRSGSSSSTGSGSVSRGGFGSSGSAHASGGSS